MSCDRNWNQALPQLAAAAGVSAQELDDIRMSAQARAQRGQPDEDAITAQQQAAQVMARIRSFGIVPPGSKHGGVDVVLPGGTVEVVPKKAASVQGYAAVARALDRPRQRPPRQQPVADRVAQAQDGARSPDAQGRLVRDPSPTVRAVLARNPALDAAAQALLADDSDPDVLESLATNPTLPPAVAATLATHARPAVRRTLAQHPTLPAAIQATLARDADSDVRWWLAGHPALDGEAQTTLARDADSGVRARLAANPALPPPGQRYLAQHGDAGVWRALLTNPALDADTQASVRDRLTLWQSQPDAADAWACALWRVQVRRLARGVIGGRRDQERLWSGTPPQSPDDPSGVDAAQAVARQFPPVPLPGIDVDPRWERAADWVRMLPDDAVLEGAAALIAAPSSLWPRDPDEPSRIRADWFALLVAAQRDPANFADALAARRTETRDA